MARSLRDRLRDIKERFVPTQPDLVLDTRRGVAVTGEEFATLERDSPVTDPIRTSFGGGGSVPSGVVGDGGASARARALALEQARQLEAQRQAQLEAERIRQAQLKQQQQAQQTQTIQQAVVTSRRPTLDSSGTPVRDIEFGKLVAEFERKAGEEAKRRGRNLSIDEREKIARDLQIPKEEVVKVETPKQVPPKDLKILDTGVGQFFATTKSPQERVADFFRSHRSPQEIISSKTDIDTLSKIPGISQITEIEISRAEKESKTGEKISSPAFFFSNLGKGLTDIGKDIISTGKEKIRTSDSKTFDFFATHKSPTEITREFFARTPSLQEIISSKTTPQVLTKIPGLSQIQDIELARVSEELKAGKKISSPSFFFEKLAEAPPVLGTISKQAHKEDKFLVPFIFEKVGSGTTEAITDIAEASLFKDSEIFAEKKSRLRGEEFGGFQPLSTIIGKGAGITAQFGLFAVPGVGTTILAAPFVSSGLQGAGALEQKIREEPLQAVLVGGIGALRVFKLASLVKIPKTKLDVVFGKTIQRSKIKFIKSPPVVKTKLLNSLNKLSRELKLQSLGLKPSKEFGLIGKAPPSKVSNLLKDIKLKKSLKSLSGELQLQKLGLTPSKEFGLIGRAPPTRISKVVKELKLKRSIKNLAGELQLQRVGLTPSKQFGLIGRAPQSKLFKVVKEVKLKKSLKSLSNELQLQKLGLTPSKQFGLIGRAPPTRISKVFKEFKLKKSLKSLSGELKLQSLGLKPSKEFGLIGRAPKKPISDTKVLSALKKIRKENLKRTGGVSPVTEVGIEERALSLQRFKDTSRVDIKITKIPQTKITPSLSQLQVSKDVERVITSRRPQQILAPPKTDVIQFGEIKDFPGFTAPISKFAAPGGRIGSFKDLGRVSPFGALQGRFQEGVIEDTRPETRTRITPVSIASVGLLDVTKPKGTQRRKQRAIVSPLAIPKTQTLIKQAQQQRQRQPIITLTQQKQKQRTTKTPLRIFKFPKLPKPSRQPSGKFQVFGRRFGKFKVVGIARTQRGAFALGKKFLRDTLGATIKIPKSKIGKLPGFRTKITPQGILFIEPRRRRLKRRGKEVQEIQIFKQAKKRKKKKGGKK